MVLCAELAHQLITAEQADFTDPPVAALGSQHTIGQSRRMSAVTGAKATLTVTGVPLRAIVAWSVYLMRERNGGKCLHRSHVLVTIN